MSVLRKNLISVIYDVAVGDDEGYVLNSPDVADAIIAALPSMVKPLTVSEYGDGGVAEDELGKHRYEWYETRLGLFNVLDVTEGVRIATEVADPHAPYKKHYIEAVLQAFDLCPEEK